MAGAGLAGAAAEMFVTREDLDAAVDFGCISKVEGINQAFKVIGGVICPCYCKLLVW
jgi:hypothetical protein